MKTLPQTPSYKLKEYITLHNQPGKFIITRVIHRDNNTVVYQVKPTKSYFVAEDDIKAKINIQTN
jgi:hypothetical protein